MAKKDKDYIVVRNTARPLSLGWGKRLDGQEGHKFQKGEAFAIPLTLNRKDAKGKDIKVDALELLKKMYPGEIRTDDGVASQGEVDSLKEENKKLKEELAALKQKGKGANNGNKADANASQDSNEQSAK